MIVPPIPERMAKLERDARGYPIPWNVLRGVDGTPFFTANDDRRSWRAIRERLCPICGDPLERWVWFVGGPLSAFDPNGWYLDLPQHEECAEFALSACPYLAAPKYEGRIDIPDTSKLPPEAAILLDETIMPERPEVFVMLTGCGIERKDRFPLQPYLRPGRPLIEWRYWRHGRRATPEEAREYDKKYRRVR